MSTVRTHAPERLTDLSATELEALIHRIVRDEIESALTRLGFYEETTVIEPGSPLYEDLMDIQQRAKEGRLEFYTYEEVFGNEPVWSGSGKAVREEAAALSKSAQTDPTAC